MQKELANKETLLHENMAKQAKVFRVATRFHLASIDFALSSMTSHGLSHYIPLWRLTELEEACMGKQDVGHSL